MRLASFVAGVALGAVAAAGLGLVVPRFARAQTEVRAAMSDRDRISQIDARLSALERVLRFDASRSKLTVSASEVHVDAATAEVSGNLRARAVITPSVVADSYTPGAGNIW